MSGKLTEVVQMKVSSVLLQHFIPARVIKSRAEKMSHLGRGFISTIMTSFEEK